MKKKLYILLLIFLSTACSAKYEISINNDKIIEKLNVLETNTSIFDVELDNGITLRNAFEDITLSDEFVKANGTLKHINSDSKIGIEYKNILEINNYSKSNVLNQCYDNPTVDITDEYFYVDSGVYFTCFDNYNYLESIEVILKTNHKVLDNNADEVKGDKYIWNITKTNYKDKNIEIKLSMTEYKKNYTFIIIVVSIVLIVLIAGLIILNIFIKKYKNKNKF